MDPFLPFLGQIQDLGPCKCGLRGIDARNFEVPDFGLSRHFQNVMYHRRCSPAPFFRLDLLLVFQKQADFALLPDFGSISGLARFWAKVPFSLILRMSRARGPIFHQPHFSISSYLLNFHVVRLHHTSLFRLICMPFCTSS